MNVRPAGLSRNGPRLLKIVNNQPHARQEDHEEYPAPEAKRQCRELRGKIGSIPAQEKVVTKVSDGNSTMERWSASPISSDNDNVDDRGATRVTEKPGPKNVGTPALVKARKSVKQGKGQFGRRTSSRKAPPKNGSQSDADPSGFVVSSGNKPAKRLTKKYGTKNVHALPKPEHEEKKTGAKRIKGFQAPRGVPLQQSGDRSNSKFKRPGHNQKRGYDTSSSESDSESDSEHDSGLVNDKLFNNARGPRTHKRPKKKDLEKPKPAGPSFKDPSSYVVGQSDSSAQSPSKFKLPNGRRSNGSDTSLSSPPESVILDYAQESLDIPLSSSQAPQDASPYAICPLCDETVERTLLDEFSGYGRGPRLSIRKQALFCHAHKRRSAIKDYRDAGYPEVDWNTFPKRLRRHFGHINHVLDRRKESWYRKGLEERVKSGKLRTLHQTATSTTDETSLNKFVPGYYGTKGARVMMESIIDQFSDKIRRLAASDDLLSRGSGGVTGYIQSVLVPELAVSLIKEDLGVDDDEARTILTGSTKIGRLVNEEEEERVIAQGDDD
ncbi:MAG: hypothetical protein M1822_002318 [Bathelium mastoideum]|nr:MAG: hypothetical protein M1822_002318 [Bathelium mastoideum]